MVYFKTRHDTYIYVVGRGPCAGLVFHKPLPTTIQRLNTRTRQCGFVITTPEWVGMNGYRGKLNGVMSICQMLLLPVGLTSFVLKLVGMFSEDQGTQDQGTEDLGMEDPGTGVDGADAAVYGLGAAGGAAAAALSMCQAASQPNPTNQLVYYKGEELLALFQSR